MKRARIFGAQLTRVSGMQGWNAARRGNGYYGKGEGSGCCASYNYSGGRCQVDIICNRRNSGVLQANLKELPLHRPSFLDDIDRLYGRYLAGSRTSRHKLHGAPAGMKSGEQE
jgi:hypothetical protein